jgi:flagellar protein FlbD
MIKVTRLNDSVLMINADMIQSLQATPDTVITLTNNDSARFMQLPAPRIARPRINSEQMNLNPMLCKNS